jgi:hypothetical protein
MGTGVQASARGRQVVGNRGEKGWEELGEAGEIRELGETPIAIPHQLAYNRGEG